MRPGAYSLKCDVNGALILGPQAREITLKRPVGGLVDWGQAFPQKAPRKWLFAAAARQSGQATPRLLLKKCHVEEPRLLGLLELMLSFSCLSLLALCHCVFKFHHE